MLLNGLIWTGILFIACLIYWKSRKRWRLWSIIQSDDPQRVESARSWITPVLVPYLIKKYWQASDWSQKRSIVELLQDQSHQDMSKLMLDFLRVPLKVGDERTELAQAIALGFVDERYDRFMNYYNDRDLLARDVRAVLAVHRVQAEQSPVTPFSSVRNPSAAKITSSALPNQRMQLGITHNNLRIVEEALRDQANINMVITDGTHKGCSALMLAVSLKHFEIAEFLIKQGADIHFTRSDLQENFHPERGQTALWWAANHGYLPLAEILIQRGADVNTPDHHGGTPLTTAASSGQSEMVQYLLNHGADIHAKISDGRKAIHLAVTNGHVLVVEYLLKAGNDANEAGGSGYTPLMVAAENK